MKIENIYLGEFLLGNDIRVIITQIAEEPRFDPFVSFLHENKWFSVPVGHDCFLKNNLTVRFFQKTENLTLTVVEDSFEELGRMSYGVNTLRDKELLLSYDGEYSILIDGVKYIVHDNQRIIIGGKTYLFSLKNSNPYLVAQRR